MRFEAVGLSGGGVQSLHFLIYRPRAKIIFEGFWGWMRGIFVDFVPSEVVVFCCYIERNGVIKKVALNTKVFFDTLFAPVTEV